MQAPFLTAEWRFLVMLNYDVAPQLLEPLVPRATELDEWQGHTYASVVGFLFLDTRLLGLPVPFHRDFEEINLRFYVRRKADDGWRRGVVFIKEIVPHRAIAALARAVYNEKYIARHMAHRLERDASEAQRLAPGSSVQYGWRDSGAWQSLRATISGEAQSLVAGSQEAFITEHYWGYAAQRDGSCIEYQVEHPPWLVWQTSSARLQCDAERAYGSAFVEPLSGPPATAFVAAGSPVTVRRGVRL